MRDKANRDETVAELAERLQAALNRALDKNSQLQTEIDSAEAKTQDAEARVSQAEARVRDTEEKLAVLENLRTQRYQTVITELFQQPSRRAAILTLAVAIISILIGLYQTITSSDRSAAQNSRLIGDMANSLRKEVSSKIKESQAQTQQEILLSEERTKADLKKALRLFTDPDLKNGVTDLQRNETMFSYAAAGESRYFKVIVPANAKNVRVTLTPITGDADLFGGFNRVPRPNSADDCRSARTGLQADVCVWRNPPAGEIFIRVQAFGEPSRFKMQVNF